MFFYADLTYSKNVSWLDLGIENRYLLFYIVLLKKSHFKKELAGEKTPDYVRNLPLLFSLFPRAKTIHIIRDGRDVALSTLKWASVKKGPDLIRRVMIPWTVRQIASVWPLALVPWRGEPGLLPGRGSIPHAPGRLAVTLHHILRKQQPHWFGRA